MASNNVYIFLSYKYLIKICTFISYFSYNDNIRELTAMKPGPFAVYLFITPCYDPYNIPLLIVIHLLFQLPYLAIISYSYYFCCCLSIDFICSLCPAKFVFLHPSLGSLTRLQRNSKLSIRLV